jgi:hypothetical protein
MVVGQHLNQVLVLCVRVQLCAWLPRLLHSGIFLCKGEAKNRTSPRTKHMGNYCRGVSAHVIHSTL